MSRTRDVRFGVALRLTVAAGVAVAASCAWLLVDGRSDGDDARRALAACGQLCAPGSTQGSTPGSTPVSTRGSTPTAAPPTGGHVGRPMPTGSARGGATPPASPRTSSSTSSSPPSPVSGPVVRFTVTSHWDSGYHADLTVVNTTGTPIVGWKLEFRVSGARLQQSDNSQAADVADVITATPASWNGTIAPGESVVLGFMFTGTLQNPSGCVLDGTPCTFAY